MMISMLSQQMQMQHQFLQQQMQMQMAAMEKRAETSEKYLRRIAKTIGKNNKRKRGGDNNDYDSTDDESDE
jgi:hypothetical protein